MIFMVLILAPVSTAAASDTTPAAAPPDSLPSTVVAIVPFANHAGPQAATDSLVSLIQQRLVRAAVRVIDPAALRETLRRHRIRTAGAISREDAARIGQERQIDYLLLGSIDIYIEGSVPEAGFSVRLVRVDDMQVVWARSDAASGEDFAGLLGIGRITVMRVLLSKLVEQTFAGIDAVLQPAGSASALPAGLIYAIVPFDDSSPQAKAGDIVSGLVLSELVREGRRVVEPGMVRELFRRNNLITHGEIDLSLLTQLRDSLGVDRVITGCVDRFQPATTGAEWSRPEVALGGRCLDAGTGRILSAFEDARNGGDSESILRLGGYHSLGRLAWTAVQVMMKNLNDEKSWSDAPSRDKRPR